MNDSTITSRPVLSQNDVAIRELKASVDALTDEVRELRCTVIGNGDPTHSLVSKVDCLLGAWTTFDEWQHRQDNLYFRAWLWHVGNSAVSVINSVLLLFTWFVIVLKW